jgi:hypothetical protein
MPFNVGSAELGWDGHNAASLFGDVSSTAIAATQFKPLAFR